MKFRLIVALICLFPAMYQLATGDASTRLISGAALALVACAVVVDRWAAAHPNSPVSQLLFRGHNVTGARVSGWTIFFGAVYLLAITYAIRFKQLDNPVVLTVAFFSIFLGLMALAATVILAVQRLWKGGGAG